ncbi:MAG: c-type cytochrome [Planctomycetota bacterium]|nr:c-type cytochrome [Planctomycetota bacterium]
MLNSFRQSRCRQFCRVFVVASFVSLLADFSAPPVFGQQAKAAQKNANPKDSANTAKKATAARKAAQKALPRPENALPNWIWLNQDGSPAEQLVLRKEFFVQGSVSAVRLFAACDDVMTVYVDGVKVIESGDRRKPVFADVTELITKNMPHVIAVEGKNLGGDAGLVVRLDLESGWRDAWSIVSDGSWHVSQKPADGWKKPLFKSSGWKDAEVLAVLGGGPWAGSINAATLAAAAPLREATATPISALKVKQGFKVELLYSVPKGDQGSWVNICTDPKGRLIVSDQYGQLYRVTPPPIGTDAKIKIEKINVDIGEAQGLLWAFDSLYVVVNKGKQYDGGLYRVRDTDGDDQLDSLELLRPLTSRGEHGPHAILLTPDGKSLYIIGGNGTTMPEMNTSRVPRVWDEDLLLPRVQGRFMRGARAPGGFVARIDPDGKQWELVATGFRNEFDAALNADGELFTFDADMEWDMSLPWYRPTRVCHVVSGAEFGWRSGGGKWPSYYADSIPATVDIGPGSPTGICFGYGAKFPAKYQNALFISDWSYGKLFAVHLKPKGATYSAEFEEFITGTPLPLTDVVINPHDNAMYFAIGGRNVQSGLYRVTYTGRESTKPVEHSNQAERDARELRRKLEMLHVGDHPDAVKQAWPHLRSSDRFIRYAARIALEHRPLEEWAKNAFEETDQQAVLTAMLAVARKFNREIRGKEPDIDSLVPSWLAAVSEDLNRAGYRRRILTHLNEHTKTETMSVQQRLERLRVLTLTFLRLGHPDGTERQSLINRISKTYPTGIQELDSESAQMLVYLQAPYATKLIVEQLVKAPTQEQQIDIAKSLRHQKVGWTPELRRTYFEWCAQATGYRGGASFTTFVQRIREDAITTLTAAEAKSLGDLLTKKLDTQVIAAATKPRPLVKKWTMQELVPLVQTGLKHRNFDKGRNMFAAAKCFACHRFDNQGGAVGPDLTGLSGRFSSRDILESVVEPSKQISDQYAAVQIVTIDGKVVVGRIVNLAGDSVRVNTNMYNPDEQVGVDRKQIDEMFPSKTSMMPAGLLDVLKQDELLDLMAYLLSRGNRNHQMFQGIED